MNIFIFRMMYEIIGQNNQVFIFIFNIYEILIFNHFYFGMQFFDE